MFVERPPCLVAPRPLLGTPSAHVAPDDAWLGGSYLKLVLANWRRPLYKKRLVTHHISQSLLPCVESLFSRLPTSQSNSQFLVRDVWLSAVGTVLSVESARSVWQANSLKESAALEDEVEEWERYQDEQRGCFVFLSLPSLHARSGNGEWLRVSCALHPAD